MDVYVGFDSAWTDNPKAPHAICAVGIEGGQAVWFRRPECASFDQALAIIKADCAERGATLIAIDQPTVVPNLTGTRPVDRVAASLISWLGGGVQPANRGKRGMFSLPRKKDQDMLDAAICELVALRWRLRPRGESMLIGNLETGYMVLPASAQVRERLVA